MEISEKYKPPTRDCIASMLFLACLLNYMMKVNFSFNLVAMVKAPGTTEEDHGPRYDWSEKDQASLLGAYYYGYVITNIPGGMLAERFGGRNVAGYTLIASSIFTALTPIAAKFGMGAVFAIRFIIGLVGGVTYPCCHTIISQWSPPDEKGKFIAALMGGTFGTIVTFPISAVIVETLSWDWAFYSVAIFSFIMCIVWFGVVTDSPAKHKSISIEEQTYIETSLGEVLSSKQVMKWPPFLSLLTSLPFIALVFLHFGNMWGLLFLITSGPKFLSEVLDFEISEAGYLSSLPHLARFSMAFVFGLLADRIRRKKQFKTTTIRKSFCIFSHIIPGLLLIALPFAGEHPYTCVAILTISLGFNGSATVTNLQNPQDLAPNYAGTLFGTINFFGSTSGFFSPLVVSAFTSEGNTFNNWKNVFFVGGAIYIIPAVIFIIFGSAIIQPWNFDKNDDKAKELYENVKKNTE